MPSLKADGEAAQANQSATTPAPGTAHATLGTHRRTAGQVPWIAQTSQYAT